MKTRSFSLSVMDVVTSSERPDLEDEAGAAFKVRWPEFIFHDPIAKQYVAQVAQCFPQYDVLLLDDGRVVAGGWGVPLAWDGTVQDLPDGYDGAMVRAVEGHQSGVQATTFSFMAVAVANGETKRALAGEVMTALQVRARQAGLAHVIAPLRPTLKAAYPLVPMATFATWTRPDGLSVDPWIRAHQRMGASILAPCSRSMVMTGTVAQWESWTDMVFPETGEYVVPDALGLVDIDRTKDIGTYIEEGLWVQHL
jgi:hypothetical protein